MYANKVVSLSVLVLILMVCLIPVVIIAADVPAKDGYIHDTAQILSNSEFNELNQAINDASFSLYVYTINDLGESSISNVGSSVFSEWSLGNQDALLIMQWRSEKFT